MSDKPAQASSQEIHGYCAHCASRCATVATVTDGRLVAVRPDRGHPNVGFCVKAGAAPDVVYSARRLRTPLKRTRSKTDPDAGWVPITWEEALATIGQRLNAIKASSGAEAVAFSRPAPGGSPACDWAPYFARLASAFGSPNTVATSHICQWGRDAGSVYTYGTGMPAPDFEHAKTIVIWGHNPQASHIQNWRRILKARNHGAQLVVVDPRRTGTVDKADFWVRLLPGSDTVLALTLIHVLLRDALFDRDFVTWWTNAPFLIRDDTGQPVRGGDLGLAPKDGFVVWDGANQQPLALDVTQSPSDWGVQPALDAEVKLQLTDGSSLPARTAFALLKQRAGQHPPEQAAARTGLEPQRIEALARLLATAGPLSYYSLNGIEQHLDTAQTNRAVCILYALLGHLDAPGGNVLFAKPGTQSIEGGELLTPEQNGKRLSLKARPLSAAKRAVQSYNLYDAILGETDYAVRALVSFGGNLLIQNGDSLRGRQALQALEFQVHADTFLNPSAESADILLPAATPWEAAQLAPSLGGGIDTVGRVQYRPAVVAAQHESLGDVEIMARIAVALGLGEHFWQGDVEASFREQLKPLGITLEELKAAEGGIDVPLKHAYRKYARQDAEGKVRGFPTPSKKVELYSLAFLRHGYDPLASSPGTTGRGRGLPAQADVLQADPVLPQFGPRYSGAAPAGPRAVRRGASQNSRRVRLGRRRARSTGHTRGRNCAAGATERQGGARRGSRAHRLVGSLRGIGSARL